MNHETHGARHNLVYNLMNYATANVKVKRASSYDEPCFLPKKVWIYKIVTKETECSFGNQEWQRVTILQLITDRGNEEVSPIFAPASQKVLNCCFDYLLFLFLEDAANGSKWSTSHKWLCHLTEWKEFEIIDILFKCESVRCLHLHLTQRVCVVFNRQRIEVLQDYRLVFYNCTTTQVCQWLLHWSIFHV